jgi:outer membrane protein assembly factor BamA
MLRASGSIALLLAGLCIAATAQSWPPGERASIQQIIFESPVQLTTIERRKISAKIRELRLDDGEELVQEAYQDKGYFLAQAWAELVPQATGGNDLFIRVSPGRQYRLIQISWRGVTLFSDSELSKLIPFQPGEIYNRSKIADGLKALTNLYDSMGYINATYVPTPETNEDAGTVAFEIEVYEGGQYHFGELDVEGMDSSDRETLISAWQQLHGSPYNKQKEEKFFGEYFRAPLSQIKPENYTFREVKQDEHVVNYSLHFVPWLRYRVSPNGKLKLVETH